MAKTYNSVSEMVKDLSETNEFPEMFERHVSERRIITNITILRVVNEVSQEQIAEKLDWTTEKVSEFEGSRDCDITVADLDKYASAIDLELTFLKKFVGD